MYLLMDLSVALVLGRTLPGFVTVCLGRYKATILVCSLPTILALSRLVLGKMPGLLSIAFYKSRREDWINVEGVQVRVS